MATAFRAAPRETVATLVLTLAQSTTMLQPLWLKMLTDGVVQRDLRRALVAVGLLASFYLVFSVVFGEQSRLRLQIGERIGFEMDRRLTELCARLPGLEHHERPEFLDRVELLRASESGLRHVMNLSVNSLSITGQFVLTVVLLATVHPLLALLPVAGLPSLVAGWLGQARVARAEEASAEDRRLASHLFDLATKPGPAKELRVFTLEDEIARRHRTTLRAAWTPVVRAQWVASIADAGAYLLRTAGLVAAVAFVVSRAVRGLATAGDVVLAVSLAHQTGQSLSSVVFMFTWLMRVFRNANRLMWLVDYSAEQHRAEVDAMPAPERIERHIELRGVSFRYPGTDAWILEDVDLRLPAGSCVAIVGDNGAGKTTLAKLLARFYEPSAGSILVDGCELDRIAHESWREKVSAGFQDFARLELLARETVGVGELASITDRTAVVGALDRAGAADVVDVLPSELETQLGSQWDGGTDLSGGQWQKLALGRAMMRETPLLLVLDEPTASLDAQTEHALFERYSDAARRAAIANGAITVLVSHRFSTVRMADLIVVLEGGRVVEQGGHDELVATGGLYAELYELQAKAYR